MFRRFNYTDGFIVEYNERCFSSWVLLPAEILWPAWIRGVLYTLAIMYLFVGVAIIADIFMLSIEIITSKRKTIVTYNQETQETVHREVLVWNETIANLTLMALGSSAPEILIAVIETVSNLSPNPQASPSLGTFTIVGSAAYNLLLISAVCIVSVDGGIVKKINEFGVFIITSIFSLFAYIWLLIVLKWSSPNVVEMWEALFTLACFPIMVLIAWSQDRGWLLLGCCNKKELVIASRSLATIKSSNKESPERHIVGIEQTNNSSSRKTSKWSTVENGKTNDVEMRSVAGSKPEIRELVHYIKDHDEADGSPVVIGNSIKKFLDQPSNKAIARARFRHAVVSSLLGCSPQNDKLPHSHAMVKALQKKSVFSKGKPLPPIESTYGAFSFTTSSYSVSNKDEHLSVEILYQVTFPSSTPIGFSHIVGAVQDRERRISRGEIKPRSLSNITPSEMNLSSRTMMSTLSANDEVEEVTYMDDPNPFAPMESDINRDKTCDEDSIRGLSTPSEFMFKSDRSSVTMKPNPAVDLLRMGSSVEYETRDGSAKQDVDYTYTRGVADFTAREFKRTIHVELISNGNNTETQRNGERHFFVILKCPSPGARLGSPNIIQISIVDDSRPGVFGFENATYPVNFSAGVATLTVVRQHGFDGHVTIRYKTIDGTAIGGHHVEVESNRCEFEAISNGRLDFVPNETRKEIDINICKFSKHGKNFIVLLQEPGNGAILGHRSATIVTMTADVDQIVDQVANMITEETEQKTVLDHWREQFVNALSPGLQDEETGKIKTVNCILHCLSFFWKVLFAFIPPRTCYGGWPTFFVSVVLLGILAAFVEQFAKLLGCVIGLHISVTGLTLIALGTSMPDTFASRSAALQDDSADAAIGNITGSNSVNVFLGLGLPWCILTMYHYAHDNVVEIHDPDLLFTVVVFLSCGSICIILLGLRRVFFKGELGGPAIPKYTSSLFLFSLWLLFVTLCSLRAYNYISTMG